MIVISLKRLVGFLSLGIVTTIFLFCIFVKEDVTATSGTLLNYKIIIDAGHGLPDGGAVSKSGVSEEGINLDIALKLRERLEDLGYEVILTRETHENIADNDKQNSLKEIKTSDLTNRVKIANESNADFMISIHMNEFSQKSSWGWQTFYSKNSEEGKRLAELTQSNISKIIDRPNKRKVLPIDGIKIVDKTNIPVIIVECGFLSNDEDLRLLQTDEYKDKIVSGIINAVEEYYE